MAATETTGFALRSERLTTLTTSGLLPTRERLIWSLSASRSSPAVDYNFVVIEILMSVNLRAVGILDDGTHDAIDIHAATIDDQSSVVIIDNCRLIDYRYICRLREGFSRLVLRPLRNCRTPHCIERKPPSSR